MEGGELFHQIVELTYFSENLARHVIVQVAQGIHYLHEERGVVHRDIKPENLLFERIPIVASKNPAPKQFDEEKEDEGDIHDLRVHIQGTSIHKHTGGKETIYRRTSNTPIMTPILLGSNPSPPLSTLVLAKSGNNI